jgi:hypothetical protein
VVAAKLEQAAWFLGLLDVMADISLPNVGKDENTPSQVRKDNWGNIRLITA